VRISSAIPQHWPAWHEVCGTRHAVCQFCCKNLQRTNHKPNIGGRAAPKILAGVALAQAHGRRLPTYGHT
jgi:hypothetical protein